MQEKPSGGGALDFATLRSQAGKLKPRFDEFVEAVATKCGAKHGTPPLKGAWRAIEKMALRVESAGGKCGALKEGPLDASPLCDVLRGSLLWRTSLWTTPTSMGGPSTTLRYSKQVDGDGPFLVSYDRDHPACCGGSGRTSRSRRRRSTSSPAPPA